MHTGGRPAPILGYAPSVEEREHRRLERQDGAGLSGNRGDERPGL